jgi:hypothetical protein
MHILLSMDPTTIRKEFGKEVEKLDSTTMNPY